MAIAALVIGLLIAALGALGIAAPETFVRVVGVFQSPPAVYVAAAIRVGVGIVLIRAARASRAQGVFRVLGVLIVVGGLLTPFVGVAGARLILGWWSAHGPALIRVWGFVAAAIGGFIAYAVIPRRRSA